MILLIFSDSCLLNLLLVQSHQVEIAIVTRLTQEGNSVTMVRVEPKPLEYGRRKNYILPF